MIKESLFNTALADAVLYMGPYKAPMQLAVAYGLCQAIGAEVVAALRLPKATAISSSRTAWAAAFCTTSCAVSMTRAMQPSYWGTQTSRNRQRTPSSKS